jgi:hypothetical protein
VVRDARNAIKPFLAELNLDWSKYSIWNPCCGRLGISKFIPAQVFNTDICQYDQCVQVCVDFLTVKDFHPDIIITNPPFTPAFKMLNHALSLAKKKVIFFLEERFFSGSARYDFVKRFPPTTIYHLAGRLRFRTLPPVNWMYAAYWGHCWAVWDIGFKGTTEAKWIKV